MGSSTGFHGASVKVSWSRRFRDGSFVRFMNQDGEAAGPDSPNAAWGPMRVVYLQYASDPVTDVRNWSLEGIGLVRTAAVEPDDRRTGGRAL